MTSSSLPSIKDIFDRLQIIYPEGFPNKHLSPEEMARVEHARRELAAYPDQDRILVQLPKDKVISLPLGPRAEIAKAVIEDFAHRFLCAPEVLFVKDSSGHVAVRNEDLSRSIRLDISQDKHLPDIVLVDLESQGPLVVFCKVVATEGPINEDQKRALLKFARKNGLRYADIALVTAYRDRKSVVFKDSFHVQAWGSFAWCDTEPDHIIVLHKKTSRYGQGLRQFMS
jgi:hypothetical protein